MKSFKFQGVTYNMMTFAKSHHISYSKLRRLCRHFERAYKNPEVACRWVLGLELLDARKEPKTLFYKQDLEKSYERHERFLEKVEDELLKCLKLTV